MSGGTTMNLHTNNRDHLDDFIRLNEAWIRHHFTLEDSDRALAANPGRIIDDGGYVFSLEVDGKVVGVCALFNEGAGNYELARMAVDDACRGQGYGDVLMEAALETLRDIGAKRVHLLSNKKLTPALALYRKHGFEVESEGCHPVYARCDVVMARPVGL